MKNEERARPGEERKVNVIHPDDQGRIESAHRQITDKINDQLVTFQDDAYALGHARGLKEGQQLRDALLAELESIRNMTNADDPESYRCDDREGCLDTVFCTADAAIAASKGGAQ